MENPYTTPQSEVETLSESGGLDNFSRFSAWWVFLLTAVTFGIYGIYWLYTRSLIINRVHDKSISDMAIWGSILAYILYMPFSFVPEDTFAYQLLILVLLEIAYLFFYLWWLFAVRNRLQEMSMDNNMPELSFGPVMTFFFQQIYLQYKINEYLDNKRVAESLDPPPSGSNF